MENNKHKGYTLVEILVAFAVLGIAVLAIGGFFVSAARSYSSVSDETSLQYEAQLTLNQIENMLIDSTLGVNYAHITDSSEVVTAESFVKSDPGTAATSKVLYVFNTKDTGSEIVLNVLLLKWMAATNSIYYKEVDVPNQEELQVTDINVAGMNGWDLLAEDVTLFSMDLNGYATTKKVQVELGFKNRSKDYHTVGTIVLRNDVLINTSDVKKIYEQISTIRRSEIDRVELTSNTDFTVPGGKVQLNTEVLGSYFPSQRIHRWTVTAADGTLLYDSDDPAVTSLTYIDTANKVLCVGDNASGILTVTAHVKTGKTVMIDGVSQPEIVSDDVDILVKVINDIIVTVTNVNDIPVDGAIVASLTQQRANTSNIPAIDMMPRQTVKMNAAVHGTVDVEDKEIVWSLANPTTGVIASIDTNGILKIGQYSTAGSVYVRAELKVDRSIFVQYKVNVGKSADKLEVIPSIYTVNRGGSFNCSLELNNTALNGENENLDYNWSVTVMNAQGHTISGKPVTIDSLGQVQVSYDLSYDYAYNIYITATQKNNTDIKNTCCISVPKVTLSLTPATQYSVMGATIDNFVCTVTGLEEYDVKWSMAKELNPDYFFTAWDNFNITGEKQADGRNTAVVKLGSAADPMTNCTVKAYLESNPNYSATSRIEISNVRMNITGLKHDNKTNGVKYVSRNSYLQLDVKLDPPKNPNFSVSKETVSWEIVDIRVNGAIKPELLDENISLSSTGLLALKQEFASQYKDKDVKITVKAKDPVHGLEATYEVTVPTLKITGQSVDRGSSVTLSVSMTNKDPNISLENIVWTVTTVSHGSKDHVTIDAQETHDTSVLLEVWKEFAVANHSSDVTITVTAADPEHNTEVSYKVSVNKVKVTADKPFDTEKIMIVPDNTGATTVQLTCSAATSWMIGDSAKNPVSDAPLTVDDTGKLTIEPGKSEYDSKEYYVYAVLSNGTKLTARRVLYGIHTQEQLATDFSKKTETVVNVNNGEITKYTFKVVASSYPAYLNGAKYNVFCVLHKTYYTDQDEPVERYYAAVQTTDLLWYIYTTGEWEKVAATEVPGGVKSSDLK